MSSDSAQASAPSPIDPRFAGIARLYGVDALARLRRAHVAVIGVGGVGSWAAEALARSGIGKLTLIDGDEVCVSNTNRQMHALEGSYGKLKVEVLAERLRAIDPALVVDPVARFLTPSSLDLIGDGGFDAVLDACDAFRVKVETIVYCRRRKIPLIVSGSAGGRVDPTQIRVRDLSRTEHDALLSLIRKKLREEFKYPRGPKRYFGVPAVYSLENVRYPSADGGVCSAKPETLEEGRLDCGGGLGAATHVTGAFAFVAVGELIRRLLLKQ
jgi:tRNA threonylcarbamoyladenosine dehydratase